MGLKFPKKLVHVYNDNWNVIIYLHDFTDTQLPRVGSQF